MSEDNLAVIPPASSIAASGGAGHAIECFDPVRQAVFLQALARTPIIGVAARAAGVSTQTCYRMRTRSKDFAAAWDQAREDAVDEIESVAIRRAVEGSDVLMGRVLAAHRPDLYGAKVDVKLAGRIDFVVDLVPMGPPHDDVDAEAVEDL